MTTFDPLKLSALAALSLPAVAFAAVQTGDPVGLTDAEITSKLEAQGYAVEEIEREDGEIEVYATLDGQLFEIELAADTGAVTETELEDEGSDD